MVRHVQVDVGRHGAGIYGYPALTHVTDCGQSNNPNGHSRSCECRMREAVADRLGDSVTDRRRFLAWLKGVGR